MPTASPEDVATAPTNALGTVFGASGTCLFISYLLLSSEDPTNVERDTTTLRPEFSAANNLSEIVQWQASVSSNMTIYYAPSY